MTLYEILLIVYLIVAIMLIAAVLLQQGKGAEMGASFGAGGSNTVFGASGSGNFMTRTTAILATTFFVISLTIGSITANREDKGGEFENLEIPALDIPDQALENEVPITEGTAVDVPVTNSDVPQPDQTEETSEEPSEEEGG
ncbi:MAG: preprotein translocase subunit SecG [Pseudomonadota bacterium]